MILFCVKVLIVNYVNYREIVKQFYIQQLYIHYILQILMLFPST